MMGFMGVRKREERRGITAPPYSLTRLFLSTAVAPQRSRIGRPMAQPSSKTASGEEAGPRAPPRPGLATLRVMWIAQTIDRARVERRALGGRLALVPTMGALHDGHVSLIEAGKKLADHVI